MGRAAVFLDLEGTLGGEGTGDIVAFAFCGLAVEAIRRLNAAQLPDVVVTNQSHIGKGLFDEAAFWQRVGCLQDEKAKHGAHWDAVCFCPLGAADACDCRKPRPGMVLRAQRELGPDLSASFLVGDVDAWDMVLAKSVGCRAVLVRTGLGEGSLADYRYLWAQVVPDHVAENVLDAVDWIIGCSSRRCLGGPLQ